MKEKYQTRKKVSRLWYIYNVILFSEEIEREPRWGMGREATWMMMMVVDDDDEQKQQKYNLAEPTPQSKGKVPFKRIYKNIQLNSDSTKQYQTHARTCTHSNDKLKMRKRKRKRNCRIEQEMSIYLKIFLIISLLVLLSSVQLDNHHHFIAGLFLLFSKTHQTHIDKYTL